MTELWYQIFLWSAIALMIVNVFELVVFSLLAIKAVQRKKALGKRKMLAVGAVATTAAFPISLLLACLLLLAEACLLFFAIFSTCQYLATPIQVAERPKKRTPPKPISKPTPPSVVKPDPEKIHELIRESITIEEAHTALSDSDAIHLIEEETGPEETMSDQEPKRYSQKAIVNVDTLSENFANGAEVNLETLKEKNLIPANTDFVKVLGRGVLDKHLIVELQDYSADAVKMIVLTGGKAIHRI